MKLIKVAAAVLNQTPLDWEGNRARILAAIDAARSEGVSLLCLPELCITGYGCEDAFHGLFVPATAARMLEELADETSGMIVSLGLPLLHNGGLFNTACLVADRRILGFVGKQHLAGEGIHYEPRWFKRWPNNVRAETELGGQCYPLGDLMFECGGVRIGFEICEDAWVASRPGADLAVNGADLILNPSASHFAFGKHKVRERFVLEGSRAFCVSYIYTNLLGNEAGRAIYDGGAFLASAGQMIARGRRFSFADFQLTTGQIDVDATRMQRARTGSFEPALDRASVTIVSGEFDFPEIRPEPSITSGEAWESGPDVKEEEFARAEALALFDYLRKSNSRGFIISLSGGADSTAVATLTTLAIRLATEELGDSGLRQKLPFLDTTFPSEARNYLSQLITCVYQSTRYSSRTTRDAAHQIASGLHVGWLEFDVEPLVQGYLEIVRKSLGRALDWATDDLALQNIQARSRAPGVWLLANIRGALLLSTSNRSEAAVGYATMDGDTCGGLAPIAGIDKHYLRHWLRWMENCGPHGVGPFPFLRAVNQLEPTAELRPADQHQTDEADLMPYELLDAVERAAIRDKLAPLEIQLLMESRFPDYTPQQLGVWIERFFRLWSRNQWKRERYAPSFHLDDENLDPKTWCRFPILSGGFQRELRELRDALAKRTPAGS
ncbi:MAG: NAD(+) synthase [Planctomycetes bacterium]|nr:NAD(+) synthase [Planctomycetota bacterium]